MVGKWYTLGLANSAKGVVLQCSTAGKLELLASHLRLYFRVHLSGFTHTLEPLTNCGLFTSEPPEPGFGFSVAWRGHRYLACKGTEAQEVHKPVHVVLCYAGQVWKHVSNATAKYLLFVFRVHSNAS